jgi:serine/threonine protein kinase
MDDTTPSDPDRHPIDVLAEEFASRFRRGEHPTVSDYVSRHPELADALREALPPIALMEQLKRRNTSGAAMTPTLPKLERLGDFKIVREVGRGGMGIVYEAWQESLGRQVALKVLSRASWLDPQRLQRFEREARAAAALHHTNIVPVFGVGEQDGLHYYVMQFIPGRSIAEILGKLAGGDHPGNPTSARAGTQTPSQHIRNGTPDLATAGAAQFPPHGRRYWRWVAEVGRQVADALQHAHAQGVLHRDVKPANLLLDDRGAVWVTDFGLAKLAELDNVTRTGDVVGTLQYLAPEGLHATTDARGDVYSVGITLYELLSLRPAFSGQSPAALMKQVAEGVPLRPRRVNPGVPRDLETIVLKATAREPSERYATAGELAEDLDNFLHDRPLTARRASSAERLWRWGRRNPAIASLAGLATACALGAMVVGWVAYGTTRRALSNEAMRLREAQTARQEAEAARRRADANVALSLKSFSDLFDRLAPRDTMLPPELGPGDRPPPGPASQRPRESQQQDAAVVQAVLNFYDTFARENSTNRALQLEAAKAYRHVGEIYTRLGRAADADAAHRRAAQIYDQLLAAAPDSTDYQCGFADAVVWIGFDGQARPGDADLLRRAGVIAQTLAAAAPGDPDFAALEARTLAREASAAQAAGRTGDAERILRRAAQIWLQKPRGARRPGRRFPPPQAVERAVVLQQLAELLVASNRPQNARPVLHEELDELGRPAPGPPRGPMDHRAINLMYGRLAQTASKAGDSDLARRAKVLASRGMEPPGGPGDEGPPGRPPEFAPFPPPEGGPRP